MTVKREKKMKNEKFSRAVDDITFIDDINVHERSEVYVVNNQSSLND
jgi:hypothetical protein